MATQKQPHIEDNGQLSAATPRFGIMRQPIVSTERSRSTIGVELTARPLSGESILQVINQEKASQGLSNLDLEIVGIIRRHAHLINKHNIPVWINLFPETLSCPLATRRLADFAQGMDLPIIFEVTERELIKDFNAVRTNLEILRRSGVKIALDDFGSGAAGFEAMFELRVDYVKFDWKFFHRCAFDPIHSKLLRSITESAHALGAKVVAEGIESPQLLEAARSLQLDFMQGFHIAYPEPIGKPCNVASVIPLGR